MGCVPTKLTSARAQAVAESQEKHFTELSRKQRSDIH